MDEHLKVFIATVNGEAANCSEAAQKGVASVIMNRIGMLEWSAYKTAYDVIRFSGFEAFKHKNSNFVTALRLLEGSKPIALGSPLDRLQRAVTPIYRRDVWPTTDAVFYYSPQAQAALHAHNPRLWRARPLWKIDLMEAVPVAGCEKDDILFYRYKATKQKPRAEVGSHIEKDEA